ncbi:MAG: hydrogenase maturation nickel metallochaperone HypA [Dehalobacterium sp.]
MHEMSIVMKFVEIAQEYAVKNNAEKVDKVVLLVGEITGVVPHYLKMFYPVVVEGMILEGSELVIETVEASVFCTDCATTYNPCHTELICPNCGSERCDVIDGKQLFVKEIAIKNRAAVTDYLCENQ